MELIQQNNPYRIAGMLSNDTAKEIERQKGKIRAFAGVGKEIKPEYNFNFLENIIRTEESIRKAFSHIEQNQDKVSYGLFWFLNTNPLNNTAIDYLKNGGNENKLKK